MAANLVFKDGFFQTESRCFDASGLKDALQCFIANNKTYKSNYLQSCFDYGFDGYSFIGQKDSSNQYASDLLHSFVISDFHTPNRFPKEFNSFFSKEWNNLQIEIRKLELEIIAALKIDGLKEFYISTIGHMISCNYYPAVNTFTGNEKERLSAHADVSLFTIFPFGFDSDFLFQNNKGEWVNIPPTTDVIVFPGYLLEVFTDKIIKALNHKVALPKNVNKDRFSFAYFSLPYPEKTFMLAGETTTSEAYFKKYLELF